MAGQVVHGANVGDGAAEALLKEPRRQPKRQRQQPQQPEVLQGQTPAPVTLKGSFRASFRTGILELCSSGLTRTGLHFMCEIVHAVYAPMLFMRTATAAKLRVSELFSREAHLLATVCMPE